MDVLEKTVLIVEDDPDMRGMMELAVEEAGYTPVAASNGREALACLEHTIPALILSDIMMPMLDGFQLYLALQQNVAYQHIPFVVVSSLAPQQIAAGHIAPAAVVQKPFQVQELLDCIEQVIA